MHTMKKKLDLNMKRAIAEDLKALIDLFLAFRKMNDNLHPSV